MARVFLSHSTQDKPKALELLAWLRAEGHSETFLDSDQETGIPAGADWERTLYKEMRRSQAVVILLTKNWMESKWCFAELTQARSMGKAIFPVVETPAGELMVGRDIQSIDLTQGREGGLERLSLALTDIALASPEGFTLPPGVPPFPGLDALSEDQAAVFFGRDEDVAALIERLRQARNQGGARLVPIVGASGSGKSSLLLAGLLPRLRRDPRGWAVLDPFRPEGSPLGRLAARLIAAGSQAKGAGGVGPGVAQLADWQVGLRSPEPTAALREIADSVREGTGRLDAGILIPIDQAESVFALADAREREGFFALLAAALDASQAYYAVATLRSEYLADLQASCGSSIALEPYPLGPLPLDRLPKLVRGPARLAGLEVDDALVDALIDDAGTAEALPLVAFTLLRLYETDREGGRLSLASYQALGDPARALSPLENAVRQTAEDALPRAGRTQAADEALKRAFIPGLVEVSADGKYARRPAPLESLPPAARGDIGRLVAARLLIQRGGSEPESGATVEVAHESLFRVWDRLAQWIGEERDFLVGRARIVQAWGDWQGLSAQEREGGGGLLRDVLLERARRWIAERPDAFADPLRVYMESSIRHDEAQRARLARLRRAAQGGLIGVALLSLVSAATFWRLWTRADAARREAEASLNVARSRTALANGDIDTAVAAALAAQRGLDTVETRSAALTAILELSPHLTAAPEVAGDGEALIAWGPRSRIALATPLGIRRIDAAAPWTDPLPELLLSGRTPEVTGPNPGLLAFSQRADGHGVLVLGDGSIALFSEGTALAPVGPPDWPGSALDRPGGGDIAAGGTRVAMTVGFSGVLTRDCAAPQGGAAPSCEDVFHPLDGPIALALDRLGERVAVADAAGRIGIHSADRGFQTLGQRALGSEAAALAWASAENRLAVATRDGRLLVLDSGSSDLRELRTAQALGPIPLLRWSPDGSRLAWVCGGTEICVSRPPPGTDTVGPLDDPERLHGHRGTVTQLAWSPDGERLASLALDDRRLRLWSLEPDRTVCDSLATGAGAPLLRVAAEQTGQRVAAGDELGGLWVWWGNRRRSHFLAPEGTAAPIGDLAWDASGHVVSLYANRAILYGPADAGESRRPLPPPGPGFSRVAALADGRLAVPVGDGRIALVSPAGGAPTYLERPPDRGIEPWGIAAARDAVRLFVAYTDGSIRVWEGNGVRVLVTAKQAGPTASGAGSLAVDASGRLVAASRNDDAVIVYDSASGEVRHRLKRQGAGSNAVAFSPSGTRLAVLGSDGRIDAWDLDASPQRHVVAGIGVPLGSSAGQASTRVRQATWVDWIDGERIAVSTANGEVLLLSVDPSRWGSRATAVLGPPAGQVGGHR